MLHNRDENLWIDNLSHLVESKVSQEVNITAIRICKLYFDDKLLLCEIEFFYLDLALKHVFKEIPFGLLCTSSTIVDDKSILIKRDLMAQKFRTKAVLNRT